MLELNQEARIKIMKPLVAYFSATGNTEAVAKTIAELLNCDSFEIVADPLYTKDDLNWNNEKSRSSIEMKDESSRPAVKELIDDIGQYNTLFLGFPIWWYVAPRIIQTFLETYDLSGMTIIPFATSGGSGLGKTIDILKKSAMEASFHEGKMLNNCSKAMIASWLNELMLTYKPGNTKFETMTDEEKKQDLFLRQQAILENFLEKKAISKEDYERSLKQLKEKMGM